MPVITPLSLTIPLLTRTLNDCQTELIAEGFFDQFPSVNIVKLKGNKLTNLPNISSSSSVILDMTYNQVSRVNNFSNPTLSSLYVLYFCCTNSLFITFCPCLEGLGAKFSAKLLFVCCGCFAATSKHKTLCL